MKYHVEFKRVTYINLRIEADSAEEAERLGWKELESEDSYGMKDAEWECNNVFVEANHE